MWLAETWTQDYLADGGGGNEVPSARFNEALVHSLFQRARGVARRPLSVGARSWKLSTKDFSTTGLARR
jgi:hypothetical protein